MPKPKKPLTSQHITTSRAVARVFDRETSKRVSWGILAAALFVALFIFLGRLGILPS